MNGPNRSKIYADTNSTSNVTTFRESDGNIPVISRSRNTDSSNRLSSVISALKVNTKSNEDKLNQSCVKSAKDKFLEFKKRPKYLIYNLMPIILLIILIIFISLVFYRGTNSIKMENVSNSIDEANREIDYLTAILKDKSSSIADITKAQENLDNINKILNLASGKKNKYIYIDNICDKTVDLCNGLIASILMVYIGSASIRLYQLRNKLDKEGQSCIS